MTIPDDTLQIVEEIIAGLDSCRTETGRAASLAQQELSHLEQLIERCFSSPHSAHGRIYFSSSTLGLAAAGRTHDVEILLTETRLTDEIATTVLDPIELNEGTYTLRILPTAPPTVYWNRPNRPQPLQDCLFVETSWEVHTSGPTPLAVNALHQLMLTLDVHAATVGVSEVTGPRFIRADGRPQDPLLILPRENGTRGRVKQKLNEGITDALKKIKIAVPVDANSNLPSPFQPHFYHISRVLALIGRTLAKRRHKELLWRAPLIGFSLAIRLKSDHILPRIHAQAASNGLSVQGIAFQYGNIKLNVYRHDEKSILWIDVDVDVWLTYSIRFPEDMPGSLFTEAEQTYWRYNIHASNCWPVCDRVIREARSVVLNEIAKARLLTSGFEDFRPRARRAAARIEPYGLAIMLELR